MPTMSILPGTSREKENEPETPERVTHWIEGTDVPTIIAALARSEARYAHFEDPALFADAARCMQLCVVMQERRLKLLWSARMDGPFGGGRLRLMRMAGCRRIVACVPDEALLEAREQLREFGLEYVFLRPGGAVLESRNDEYSVAEREAVAVRLPGVPAVQFELAVTRFMAGSYGKVMQPLARAVALGFPASELSLNLAACLKTVLDHPDLAEGRSVLAGPGAPHPVVMRNRRLMRSWLEKERGARRTFLLPDPAEMMPFY